MSKKIYFVTPQLKTGGGNRVFIELANVLAGTNDISIIFPNNSTEKNTFNVSPSIKLMPIGKLASSSKSKLFNLFTCITYINRNCKDGHVIITDPIMCLLGCFLSVKLLYRFVQADDYRIFDDKMILKNDLFLNIYKWLCKRSYHYKMKYIFNSQFTYNKFVEVRNSRGKVPSYIVHPALNHAIFTASPSTVSKVAGEKLKIVLIARKHPLKGLDTFLQAWTLIKPDVKQLVEKVTLISHDDLTTFDVREFEIVRPKSDYEIASFFRESDIFISTSWSEGFGLPPLEAMSCGCAVITSKSGGVNEYAHENENCLMFDPKNAHALVDCIERLVHDPMLRMQISKQGLETAQNFTWENSANQLLKILSDNEW